MNTFFGNYYSQLKSEITHIQDIMHYFVKVQSEEWTEFDNFESKRQYELNEYLNFKEKLLRKKEKYIGDPHRWEIPESEFKSMDIGKLNNLSKEDKYDMMFPADN